ncbi:MAG: hypothetical protein PHV20_02290 [Bacteroidales bacterium]|nr:hypothetical protein [Bacteroidales bacterium]
MKTMKLLTFILISLCLSSCDKKTEKPVNNKPLTEEEQKNKLANLDLNFSQPVLIDSSEYVMYPLVLENNDEENSGFSSSSRGATAYWNIIFYNTQNGEYHLLSDSLKMVINDYSPTYNEDNSSYSSSYSSDYINTKCNQVDDLLYYTITITDFNHDGKLNSSDPNYLFISDKSGRHFKQISPINLNVENWRTIRGTNKILIQLRADSNNNKKFDSEDTIIPMVYDLNKDDASKEIFNKNFKLHLKKLLYKHWLRKE